MLEEYEVLIILAYALIVIFVLQRAGRERHRAQRDRLRQEALEAPYAPTEGPSTRLSYTPKPLPDRTERPFDRYRYRYVLEHRDGRAVWRVDDYNQVQKHATSPGAAHAIAETLVDRQLYFN